MTLEELFALYRLKKLRFKSENTIRLYGHTLRSYARTLGRTPTIADLDSELIEMHMDGVVKRGRSPATANKDRGQLLALWRFAAEKRLVEQWPQIQAMTEPEIVPLGWLPEELQRLMAACANAKGDIAGIPSSVWWASLVAVLLDTGERIGAVTPLQKEHFQNGWILCPATFRKGRKRDRLYRLQPATVKLLKQMVKASPSTNDLFPWDRSKTYIYKRFSEILIKADLPTDKRSKFHRIRRTVASAVTAAGGDATAALDHASPKTTKKYLDPRIVGSVPVSDIVGKYVTQKKKAS